MKYLVVQIIALGRKKDLHKPHKLLKYVLQFQSRILKRIKRMGSKHCEGYNPYSGLEIFAYLLFMVYLLQFLGTLLSSANFNIMLNGQAVSPFQALLLGFFGFSSTNVISNNNNNNVRVLIAKMFLTC